MPMAFANTPPMGAKPCVVRDINTEVWLFCLPHSSSTSPSPGTRRRSLPHSPPHRLLPLAVGILSSLLPASTEALRCLWPLSITWSLGTNQPSGLYVPRPVTFSTLRNKILSSTFLHWELAALDNNQSLSFLRAKSSHSVSEHDLCNGFPVLPSGTLLQWKCSVSALSTMVAAGHSCLVST